MNDASLVEGVRSGDRRALAKAITLVESTKPEHRGIAASALDALLPHAGGAMRVGLSGAPGVGKSTLIDALGSHVVQTGSSVAVLAVDPSSSRTGGSLLGDKTRMESLARHPQAFVRPSPAGTARGGVARGTRDAMLLCEAAGFDVVIVETVGVGQAEADVEQMVDTFVLLVQPGAGDELQAMKRGIVELADIVAVTKADGSLGESADAAVADYRHALGFIRPKHARWNVPVIPCSAVTGRGIADLWSAVREHGTKLEEDGERERRRAVQAKAALWAAVHDEVMTAVHRSGVARSAVDRLEEDVLAGRRSPLSAAADVVAILQSAALSDSDP